MKNTESKPAIVADQLWRLREWQAIFIKEHRRAYARRLRQNAELATQNITVWTFANDIFQGHAPTTIRALTERISSPYGGE